MTLNEIFLGQNSYNEDETIEYLADASLRPELLRPPPPLFLNPDGDDLFWLNPVDIQECLGDLEFIYEPRMCVESKASSLTEARRLMHRACKGNFTKSLTVIKFFCTYIKYTSLIHILFNFKPKILNYRRPDVKPTNTT